MKKTNVYICSCDVNGGIYHYTLENNELTFIDKTPLDRPMYMIIKENKAFIILRECFEDHTSGVVTYDIDSSGNLINKSNPISTKGIVACHIEYFKNNIYCVNYLSGNVIKLPDTVSQHIGKGVNPKRQDSAHTHFIHETPDGRYLFAVDLGIDKIITYDENLIKISECCMPNSYGPRHLAYSEDKKTVYCVNELDSSVSLLEYDDGRLIYKSSTSTLPTGFCELNTAAAIRVYNSDIYVSNRGHDSIACYKKSSEDLILKYIAPCHGKSPRDFNIIGNTLICTNESSDSITLFDIKNNGLDFKSEIKNIKSPLCVSYIEL